MRLRIYTDKNRSPGDCLSENPETEGEHGVGGNKDLAVRGWYPEFTLDVKGYVSSMDRNAIAGGQSEKIDCLAQRQPCLRHHVEQSQSVSRGKAVENGSMNVSASSKKGGYQE